MLPGKCCLSHDMCIYQVMMTLHYLNDIANDAKSTQKSIVTPYLLVWRVNQLGKLINRIPGLLLWYQVYQALLLECMLNRMASLTMSTSLPKALPGKHDIKRHSPSILYLSVTSHTNCIVAHWPDKCCLSQGMCLYQVIMMLNFLNDVVNDIESTWNSIIMS